MAKAFRCVLLSLLLLHQGISNAQDSLFVYDSISAVSCLAIFYPVSHPPENGRHVAYYENDTTQLAVEAYYKNGKLNGRYRSFYPNGNVMEFGVYANGLRNGEWSVYDRNEKIIIKGRYTNETKHGYWAYIYTSCYGRYKNGLLHGNWTCYTEELEVKFRYKQGRIRSKKTAYRKILRLTPPTE
jgi:antitoxin component YwqK of YwqJK toxin-antitoxin module